MKKKTDKISRKERVEWAYGFKASKTWLVAVKADKGGSEYTQSSYAATLFDFCEWLKKTPDQLITERKAELKSEDAQTTENTVREFDTMLEEEKEDEKGNKYKVTRTTIAKHCAHLLSFYKYNGFPLKLKVPKHTMHVREPHTVEELKTLIQFADPRERAILLVIKDSGISREDVVKLKYGDIQQEFESGKDFIRVHLTRQKEQVEYDTFLGPNAVQALKIYLQERKSKDETINPDSPLLANIHGKPLTPLALSMTFVRLSVQTGFNTSPHRLRKYFESHMGLSAPSIMVKYWLGHSLGAEKSYFMPSIEDQRRKYAEAYKELDIYRSEVNVLEQRKQQMRDTLELMRASGQITQEKIDGIVNIMARAKTPEELEDVFRERKDCNNGQNCQKIIEEPELSSYMEKGWKFISALPSGKIVISNE